MSNNLSPSLLLAIVIAICIPHVSAGCNLFVDKYGQYRCQIGTSTAWIVAGSIVGFCLMIIFCSACMKRRPRQRRVPPWPVWDLEAARRPRSRMTERPRSEEQRYTPISLPEPCRPALTRQSIAPPPPPPPPYSSRSDPVSDAPPEYTPRRPPPAYTRYYFFRPWALSR